jgi:hypothetical protein
LLSGFKKLKSNLDADIQNYMNEHGKENSIKRRIVKKFRQLQSDYRSYKHRFPTDFNEVIEPYLVEVLKFVVDFERELKAEEKESVTTTVELEDVRFFKEKGKKTIFERDRVGEGLTRKQAKEALEKGQQVTHNWLKNEGFYYKEDGSLFYATGQTKKFEDEIWENADGWSIVERETKHLMFRSSLEYSNMMQGK